MKYISLLLLFVGCSAHDLDKSDSDPTQAKSYTITRQFQRVVRYDCTGAVTSDQTETVSPPNISVKIDPKTDTHLDHAEFTDVQTGSQPHCFEGLTQFQIDTSPTVCNMQVAVGINEIKYAFYYCSAYYTAGSCTSALQMNESGQLYINVKYQEQTLQGKAEVHPTPADCAPPTPTPNPALGTPIL